MMREAKRFITMLLATAVVATSVPVINTDAATVNYVKGDKVVKTVSVSDNETINVTDNAPEDAHILRWEVSGNTVSANFTVSGDAVVSANAIYVECGADGYTETTPEDATCLQNAVETTVCILCGETVSTNEIENSKVSCKYVNGKCKWCGDVEETETPVVPGEPTTPEEPETPVVPGKPTTPEGPETPSTSENDVDKKEEPKVCEHKWDAGVVTKEATAAEAGVKTYTCTACKETKTETIAKLKATIKLNVKSIKLKTKQSTKAVVVSGLAKGDKVAKWESNNKKVVKVDKKGKITAASKTGTAKITVTTKCGAKATLKVTVQKKAVKLTKLTVNKKNVTLKKGEKFTIVAKKTPITAADKVTFKTSNKKVAKVNKNGVITAGNKTGKATITVKAGKKTVKVTVKVKKAAKKK